MTCSRCGKEILEDQVYTHKGKRMCDDCYLSLSRFPLRHTGSYMKLFYIKDSKQNR